MGREASTADQQEMPTKACSGCGSEMSHLVTIPGQLVTINEAWWHIPCYNKATPEAKDAATQAIRDSWAEIQVKWVERANRHCNGGPGSDEHRELMKKRLGPVRYRQYMKKRDDDNTTARVKSRKDRAALKLTK